MAQVFIGIGSSLDRQKNITLGIASLKAHFGEIRLSNVYESESVGFEGQHFYNLVAELHTDLSVVQVIQTLKAIEIELGRPEKTIKFAPRALDLDILLYEKMINKEVNIPRSEIIENAFVLQPLAELAPNLSHPILKMSYQQLWQQYPTNKQKLWQINVL